MGQWPPSRVGRRASDKATREDLTIRLDYTAMELVPRLLLNRWLANGFGPFLVVGWMADVGSGWKRTRC